MFVVDETGVIVLANGAVEALFGYEREELIGSSIDVLVPPDVRPRHEGLRASSFAEMSERPLRMGRDLTARRKDGSEFPAEIGLGFTSGPSGPLAIALVTDVTDRVAATARAVASEHEALEDELRESRARLRAMADGANDAVVSADGSQSITYFNPAAERVFGYAAEEVMGRSVARLMPERFHDAHWKGFSHHLETGEARIVGRTSQVAGRRSDGSEFPVEISLSSPYHDAEGPVVTAVIRDLSEQRAAEEGERLQAVARERTRLLDRMVVTLDLERRNLAAELRDTPIQHLASAALRLSTLERQLGHEDDAVRERLAEVAAYLDQEIDGLRQMVRRLHPPSLYHGVVAAVRELCEEIADDSGIAFVVTAAREDLPMVPAAETALFRIAQEATANVVRHSGARRCEVSIREIRNEVVLSVRDEGRGFDVDAKLEDEGKAHFGLLVVRERAEMVGGEAEFRSTRGEGTEVIVRIPTTLGVADPGIGPR